MQIIKWRQKIRNKEKTYTSLKEDLSIYVTFLLLLSLVRHFLQVQTKILYKYMFNIQNELPDK